jgi:nicotinamidase-related amidase
MVLDRKGEPEMLTLRTRHQELVPDENRRTVWRLHESEEEIDTSSVALLLCDVWDSHWCRGAVERLEGMIPRMDRTVSAARSAGISIIHAPSGTIGEYKDSPARHRILEASPVEPTESEYADPSLPVDDSDEGSDTGETEMCQPWRSQHPGIQIDPDLDVISDNGKEIYSFLHARKIETLLILGVHTNMCILHRSFGIKQMVRWGVRPILIRDLTDAMYNPAMSPYVSHEAGTDLVIGYIEKFWCPTMLSSALA